MVDYVRLRIMSICHSIYIVSSFTSLLEGEYQLSLFIADPSHSHIIRSLTFQYAHTELRTMQNPKEDPVSRSVCMSLPCKK